MTDPIITEYDEETGEWETVGDDDPDQLIDDITSKQEPQAQQPGDQ